MGMTDRQFDSYQENLMRRLERALADAETKGNFEELKKIIADINRQLKRP